MSHDQNAISPAVQPYRKADHEVQPVFVNRWSPRAFSPEPIEDATLWGVFEAGRWAPSSYNEQPWRFIIARSEADRKRFLDFLLPMNQAWAQHAPVLLVMVAKKTFSHNGTPNSVAVFDCGTAWGYMSLQAAHNGLITHGMAGFDRDKARVALEVPDDYDIVAVIAMGKHGDKAQLPEAMQEREVPSDRRPAKDTVMEGRFSALEEAKAEAETEPSNT